MRGLLAGGLHLTVFWLARGWSLLRLIMNYRGSQRHRLFDSAVSTLIQWY